MKILVIEKCGECRYWHRIHDSVADRGTGHFCERHKIGREFQRIDPDSSPPDGCPLLDLDVVLEKVKAENPYDPDYACARDWNDGVDAVGVALKGGGGK